MKGVKIICSNRECLSCSAYPCRAPLDVIMLIKIAFHRSIAAAVE